MTIADAKAKAESFVGTNNVKGVYIGYKYVGGERTDQIAVVFLVGEKLPLEALAQPLPKEIDGVPTDVIESGEITAQAYTEKKRPCPGGFSVAHRDVTAGTLGAWVRRGASNLYRILSNAHVLSNTNAGKIGDEILQPGPYDGGRLPDDQIGKLEEFVRINFPGGKKKKKEGKRFFWQAAKFVPNTIARLVGCPYRLVIAKPFETSQPDPNLVDCALALPLKQEDVDPTIYGFGSLQGIRDPQLGDRIKKAGRSTEGSYGIVEGVDATLDVSYGSDGVARFDEQIIIRGERGEFSAPGDSGSAILTSDNYLSALLFAGGDGITVANRISHVISFLQIRI